VADTVDDLLRGDPVAPELRWRDEEGVHRSQARPRPSPREQLGSERFAGLVGGGQGWRTEPGWRGESPYRTGGYRETERGGLRSGYRPGASGGWRQARGRESSARAEGGGRSGGRSSGRSSDGGSGGPGGGPAGSTLPGERFAVPPGATGPGSEIPFVAGDIADRGPLERGDLPAVEPRARDARELQRQKAWAEQATRAITALKAEEGTGPVNGDDLDEDEDEDDEALADRAIASAIDEDGEAIRVDGAGSLPTLRVLPQGISRKRLEQAIRELQLPVIVARDVDEADVVMTLKNEYKQKTPRLREAEERGLPIYVLKSNTIVQMQASLTSVFSLEVDPREAALRETEDAIGIVLSQSAAVELSPQNAYIRRLQHQMAERANLVSRSRGREPYRRVRLYPDAAKAGR
jgi:hypothetical protein